MFVKIIAARAAHAPFEVLFAFRHRLESQRDGDVGFVKVGNIIDERKLFASVDEAQARRISSRHKASHPGTAKQAEKKLLASGWRAIEIETPARVCGGLACGYCSETFCKDGVYHSASDDWRAGGQR